MKIFGRVVLGVILYLLFLVWLFPYDSLVERTIRNLESTTGASVSYTPVSAGPTGVRLKNVTVALPSGATLTVAEARAFPTREGIWAELKQDQGLCQVRLDYRRVDLEMDSLEIDTGSSQFGVSRFTGTMGYDLQERTGKGELHLAMPKFQAPLIPETSIDVGGPFEIHNSGTALAPHSSVTADLKLVSGDSSFSASGPVVIQAQPTGGSPLLSGNLRFEAPTGRGMLRLGGTWGDPTWTVIPN